MASLKWLLPIALSAGCSIPSDTLYVDRVVETGNTHTDRSEVIYATNKAKNSKQLDNETRSYLGRLDGSEFDMEFLEYKEDDKTKDFYAALKGNPEPLYVVLNLVKNDGDFARWYIARLENDGAVLYHKVCRGLKNTRTGANADTGTIYMLKLSNGSTAIIVTDEHDGEALRQRGIGTYVLFPKIAKSLPTDAVERIKSLSGKPKEQATEELRNLNEVSEPAYAAFKEAVQGAGAYAWPVTEYHRMATEKLMKLDEQGKIKHFRRFKLVTTPDDSKYYDFGVITSGDELVLFTEEEVPELAQNPEATIAGARHWKLSGAK